MKTTHIPLEALSFVTPPRVLVVRANFHASIIAMLSEGAETYLKACNAVVSYIDLTGALEIPAVLHHAHKSQHYDAYVVLGCVIRGDTGHYDVVVEGVTQGIMQLVASHGLLVGNGILTVENEFQANERANPQDMNKGGGAAYAALQLLSIVKKIGNSTHTQGGRR